jgi:hypothetical protein
MREHLIGSRRRGKPKAAAQEPVIQVFAGLEILARVTGHIYTVDESEGRIGHEFPGVGAPSSHRVWIEDIPAQDDVRVPDRRTLAPELLCCYCIRRPVKWLI